MKKIFIMMTAALCVLLTGCNNKFAQDEYDDPAKIASSDRYAKEKSVINTNDSGFTLEIGRFDGRETVWKYTADEDGELSFSTSFEISDGKAKLVFVSADENITIISDLIADKMDPLGVSSDKVTVKVKKGENYFKLLGCDAKNVKAKLSIEGS